MAKNQIKVNQTDMTVPSAEDAPAAYEAATETDAVANAVDIIEAATETDAVDDWNKVADMLYDLEHRKHELTGLHQSRLGRLLERLP